MPEAPVRHSRRPQSDQPRIGVYVCDCGGNISDTVRCDQVARALGSLPDVAVSRRCQFMCSDAGQQVITDDIKELGIDRVVVGACSLFLHEQTFRKTVQRAGLNPYMYYHIGLREQDSWVHHVCSVDATEKAVRLMSAGIAKARLMTPLDVISLRAEKHVLVIGGGVAGLRAALSISRSGLEVTLIEKSHFLGGHLAQWDRIFPDDKDARTLLQTLIGKVIAEPNVTVLTGTELVSVRGYVGNFEIRLRQQGRGVSGDISAVDDIIASCPVEVADEYNFGLTTRKAIFRPFQGCYPPGPVIDREHCTRCGKCLTPAGNGVVSFEEQPVEFERRVGAVVVATGFRPYEPPRGELGYGEYPEVITLPQLERLLARDGPAGGTLNWNGHPVRRLSMIHCVGSRQVDGVHQPQPDGRVNEYCSRVCCTATLHAANVIRERFPDVTVYDIYQDIRTYGRGHEEYYSRASKNRVTFLRYPAEDPPVVMRGDGGADHALLVRVRDTLTWGEEIELPVDLVVLSVGMVPNPLSDLITMLKVTPGNDRFLLEVHPKLRPVETTVPGVVLAGTAQGPMNVQESCAAAEAAACKVGVLLRQGAVELEPYVAAVDPDRCQGTGECVRVCPQEDAIRMVRHTENGREFDQAVVTAANCNGCGVCVSACPNRAIDIQGWRLDEFEAMVEALTMPVPALEGTA